PPTLIHAMDTGVDDPWTGDASASPRGRRCSRLRSRRVRLVLYFDRQDSVALRGSTTSVVVYSYAHLPLLMGLAALSAGVSLLIERAGDDHLGAGPSVALLGGVVFFLLSLVAARAVTVSGPRRLGIALKIGTTVLVLGLLVLERSVSPDALAGSL